MKNWFILLLAIMASACKSNPESFLELFPKTVSTEVMPCDGFPADTLGMPEAILANGDYWVFLEPNSSHFLSFYDCRNRTFFYGLNKGQGADEATSVQTIGIAKDKKEVYASDLMSQSVFILSLNDSVESIRKDAPGMEARFCEVAYDEDLAFFLLVGNPNRFLLKHGNKKVAFGKSIAIPGIAPEIASHTLQGPCVLSHTKKRIAWFSVYGDVMEIYDYHDLEHVSLVRSHACRLPLFSGQEGVVDLQTKLGVSSVTSDGDYIYALYNERNLEQAARDRGQAFFSNKILLFDWDGNPLQVLELDRPVKSITYDKERGIIVCLGLNDDLEYFVYTFPAGKAS